jgi:DNA-binding NarL/FixJ family response regulator
MVRVLLVEDSPLVCERLERLVAAIPGAVTVGRASGADEAVGRILAERPDAVMLDLNLAQGSGFDVLRVLREQAPEIDCYVLSNFCAEPYRRRAKRLGARGFFDKTTEFERMREVLAARAAPALG